MPLAESIENVCVLPHTVLPLCYSRVAPTLMMLPASTTATEVSLARAPHPAQNSTIKWKLSEVCCTSYVYMADSNNMSVAQTEPKLPSSSSAGLSSALAGQVPATLELKVEKPDKDDMRDDLSENRSDDESDKNMRTPRAGTRTRYCVIVTFISHIQTWERHNNLNLLFKNKFFYGHVISSKMVLSFTVSLKMRTSIQSRRPSVSVREGWLTMPVSA